MLNLPQVEASVGHSAIGVFASQFMICSSESTRARWKLKLHRFQKNASAFLRKAIQVDHQLCKDIDVEQLHSSSE